MRSGDAPPPRTLPLCVRPPHPTMPLPRARYLSAGRRGMPAPPHSSDVFASYSPPAVAHLAPSLSAGSALSARVAPSVPAGVIGCSAPVGACWLRPPLLLRSVLRRWSRPCLLRHAAVRLAHEPGAQGAARSSGVGQASSTQQSLATVLRTGPSLPATRRPLARPTGPAYLRPVPVQRSSPWPYLESSPWPHPWRPPVRAASSCSKLVRG